MVNIIKFPCDEGIIRSKPGTGQCQQRAKPWVLVATILGSSMAFIDSTVVNVALPTLQNQLGATVSDAQWVVESYALFVSALILVGGTMSDRFGRRRIFVLGVALFTSASIGCGLSPSVSQLIVARGIQGIGGALLIPGSLAIISASFLPEERGRAISLWSGFTAITSAVGPVLGGWLIDHFSWRWIFWINLPLAIVIIMISISHVPESRDQHLTGRLDHWGAFFAVLGLGSVVYGLLESANFGVGNPWPLGAICLGIGLLIAFLWIEARTENPMMPLTLYRSRTFTGANLLTLLLYAALGGVLFFLPLNLIQVQDYSATAAGAALVPLPVILFILSRWSGGLVNRYGSRLPLVIGPVIVAIGFGLMAIPQVGGSYWCTFFPAVIILGLGMAICVAPLTTTVMGAVKTHHAGVASGINNAVSRLASLMAIAVLGIVMLTTFTVRLQARLIPLNLSPESQQFLEDQFINLGAAEIPPELSQTLMIAVENAISAAFVDGFRVVMGLAALLSIASSVISALMIEEA